MPPPPSSPPLLDQLMILGRASALPGAWGAACPRLPQRSPRPIWMPLQASSARPWAPPQRRWGLLRSGLSGSCPPWWCWLPVGP